MIVLYTTNCPRCNVLEKKLDNKNIKYTKEQDIHKMLELGIENTPMLQIDKDTLFSFKEAVDWINSMED